MAGNDLDMNDITYTEGKTDQEHSQYPVVVVPSIPRQEHHTPTTAPDLDPKHPVPVSRDSDQEQNNRCYVPSQTHTIQTNIDPANNSEQTHTSQTNIDPTNNSEQTVPNGEHAEKHSGIKKILHFKKILAITCTSCLIIFAAAVVILISFLLKTTNEVHKEIGDNSGITSDLVSLGSGGNINITLEEGGDIIVYITESIPEKNSDTLEEVAIPPLSGKARQNYNYNRNNQPIYLLENSVLTYELLIVPKLHSCPAQLFFFDNYESYSNFINYASYKTIASSPCFGFSDTWSYNITKSSIVYAAIAIDDNVTVAGNVSGTQFYYNTTNLAHPSSCKYPLNGHNLSCVINTKLCSTKYALIAASNVVKVKYNSNWLQLPCSAHISSIVLLTIVILVISIFCVVAFVWHQYKEKVQHRESEPIDTCSRITEQSEPTGSRCSSQSTESSEQTEITPLMTI